MRDGQESEKRRENRLPERRRWADRGGDSLRGLNRRAYARGPGQSRARFTTNRGHASLWRAMWADVGHCIPQTYVAEDGQNGFGLFMDDISIVQAASTTTGECDVEGPRRPTRARGPSLLSVNLTIRKTMRWCKKDDQGGQLDEEEATTTGEEPRGTPLARHEQTCGHCKHFT